MGSAGDGSDATLWIVAGIGTIALVLAAVLLLRRRRAIVRLTATALDEKQLVSLCMESSTPPGDTAWAMSKENVENARRGYAVLNEAYRAGDPSIVQPILEEYWDRDAVFEPAGVLPDSSPRPHKGWDGVLAFIGNQMEAFSEGGWRRRSSSTAATT